MVIVTRIEKLINDLAELEEGTSAYDKKVKQIQDSEPIGELDTLRQKRFLNKKVAL